MKKALIMTLAISLIVAGVAVATVVSTKHDLRAAYSGEGYVTDGSTTQVCVYCHHPHRGDTGGNVSTVLLWNISDQSATYSTYQSPSANSAADMGGNVGTGDSAQYTLLCMGCHDGDSANNTFVRQTQEAGADLGTMSTLSLATAANLGSTLADDHPVDFTYPTAADLAATDDLKAADAAGDNVTGSVTSTNYPLFTGTMQCATCHNVHNGQSAGIQFMRGTSNIIEGSEICRDCHTSK